MDCVESRAWPHHFMVSQCLDLGVSAYSTTACSNYGTNLVELRVWPEYFMVSLFSTVGQPIVAYRGTACTKYGRKYVESRAWPEYFMMSRFSTLDNQQPRIRQLRARTLLGNMWI